MKNIHYIVSIICTSLTLVSLQAMKQQDNQIVVTIGVKYANSYAHNRDNELSIELKKEIFEDQGIPISYQQLTTESEWNSASWFDWSKKPIQIIDNDRTIGSYTKNGNVKLTIVPYQQNKENIYVKITNNQFMIHPWKNTTTTRSLIDLIAEKMSIPYYEVNVSNKKDHSSECDDTIPPLEVLYVKHKGAHHHPLYKKNKNALEHANGSQVGLHDVCILTSPK